LGRGQNNKLKIVNSKWLISESINTGISWKFVGTQLKFLGLVLILATFVNISQIKSLQTNLPLSHGEKPVIERGLPSPSPQVAPTAKSQNVAKQVESVGSRVGSSSNPLCRGITDYWVLVADPAHEGQYVICNTVAERMTTVEELNAAQNDYRRDQNINTLSINVELCTVASERAKEISLNFSHDGFEAAIDRHNISKSAVGENIASGPLLGIHFVQWAWDRSPGHRENMLRDWTEGCGGVYDRFAVFIFAK